MKQIKLDHELAQLVVADKKTSTWRLFDDKDLSVNDVIEFIDKVNPRDKSTWVTCARARIDQVTEKRFKDLVDADYEGHNPYKSKEEMYKTFSGYYNVEVDDETPLKIITFTLLDEPEQQSAPTGNIAKAKMYSDGGSRGNPGPSAYGYVLFTPDDEVISEGAEYLGITTNNQAEYQSLKHGVEDALKHNIQELEVYMDSMLVVNQMKGIYKVKNRDLWPIYNNIKQQATKFKKITYQHVPREHNKHADALVNEALDAQKDV